VTVFIAHTEADMDAAESLAKAIERRGHFVEHESGERVGRPLLNNDALVLIWSQAMLFDVHRLVAERRALDAWADGKLIVVARDRTMRPVGLRDLPVIDASFKDRWPITWDEVVTAINRALHPPPSPPANRVSRTRVSKASAAPSRDSAGAKPGAAKANGAGAGGLVLLVGLLALIGLVVFLWRQMEQGALGMAQVAALAGLGGALLILFVLFGARIPRPRRRAPAAAKPEGPPVFVSYAHGDASAVKPLVAVVEQAGRPVWMDDSGIEAGEGWAGEIVRAIKSARSVMVMCSAAAFQSDHVKREVYLADRYQKPMLPVFLEAAALPEDFEYFFAGVQWLELHKAPEAERAGLIRKALAAV
jgi:hypothetical protein